MMKWCPETAASRNASAIRHSMGRSLAAKTEKIVCNFIGDFKVGDNMLVNAGALCRLSETNENGISTS
jgi:hypothetical protein